MAAAMSIGAPTDFKRGIKNTIAPGDTDNLTDLENLTEDQLLLELTVRYKADVIYTYVGDILCAVNPFKSIPGMYEESKRKAYSGMAGLSDQPPHIFASADSAFSSMVNNLKGEKPNQVCVISGESGAGKTESAKLFLRHIIHLSNKSGVAEGAVGGLEDKIIDLNPLLEAFGNAQTLMNDNSSRFGKFTELRFDFEQHITGAIIREYLLEKSRVISQCDGERNFHIFYIFFAGIEDKEKFGLDDPMEHRLINNNEDAISEITLPRTKTMWSELNKCFNVVGFTEMETQSLFHVLAGVLHLGDVEIGGEGENAYLVSADEILRKVSEQFQINMAPFQEALVVQTITTRGESVARHYKQADAEDARDALCKAIYEKLFSWIFKRVNELLGPKSKSMEYSTISILDIFGFEVFDSNSLEQLLINLANEQLQAFFNSHIFEMELAEYAKEGIDGTVIEFSDNSELLALLLGKPIGLLALADEEARVPQGTDITMLGKLKMHLKSVSLTYPRGDDPVFTINHYAGNVTYDVEGFLDKNRDTLAVDLVAVMRLSGLPILEELFGGTTDSKDKKGKKGRGGGDKLALRKSVKKVKREMDKANKQTLAAIFKGSLASLIAEMNMCTPQFVRCIKPNLEKAPNLFKLEMVTKQLRYTGMLETTRIRKEGYSHRPTFTDFINRYKVIAFGLNTQPPATAQSCQAILARSGCKGWQVGKTKVFLRYFHMAELAQTLLPYPTAAGHIQTAARCFVARTQLKDLLAAKRRQDELMASFFNKCHRACDTKYEELKVLSEEDSTRPPDFFERKAKAAKSIKNKTMKRMQKQGNKKGISRAQSVKWFKEVEMTKGAGQSDDAGGGSDGFEAWFHGIISRKDSEVLLLTKSPGAFLVRVSETRFGYSLSHYIEDGGRIKHYMIDVLGDGQYQVVGNAKLFSSLNELVGFHQRHRIVATDPVCLIEPCGQVAGHDDLEEIKNA
eukprot:m.229688 g.229688  ORF g.229688 m.229688 type:complete len:966 (+) comp26005_c0_seq2:193-3090(+)